jgi:hypothetical protein
MKQNTKDWIQYSSAVLLLVSAVVMAFTSFFLTMEIGVGPLTYIGEALTSALGLFGIGVYAVNKVKEIRREIRTEFDELKNSEVRGLHEEE